MLATGTLLYGTELTFVGVIGFLGWLLAVYCIVDKHDPEKDKKLHLFDELVRATFVAVTMVAAVNIGFQIALHLPGEISDRVAQANAPVIGRVDEAENAITTSIGTAADGIAGRFDDAEVERGNLEVSADGREQRLLDRIAQLERELKQHASRTREPRTFAAALIALRESGGFTRERVQALADRHLAGEGILPDRGSLYLRLPGDRVWSCSFSIDSNKIYAHVGEQYQ